MDKKEVGKMKEEIKDFCYCVKDDRVAVLVFTANNKWKYVAPDYFENDCIVV